MQRLSTNEKYIYIVVNITRIKIHNTRMSHNRLKWNSHSQTRSKSKDMYLEFSANVTINNKEKWCSRKGHQVDRVDAIRTWKNKF